MPHSVTESAVREASTRVHVQRRVLFICAAAWTACCFLVQAFVQRYDRTQLLFLQAIL